jgi:DNA-binding MarR family transcriptional regulator
METPGPDGPPAGAGTADQVAALRDATRVLAGVALRSLDVLGGVVTLAQFRVLAVLTDLGQARSAQVAGALGLDASTVTRLADRLVEAGHVIRGSDPAHRSVVTLELTASGRDLVAVVAAERERELRRLLASLPLGSRQVIASALRQLVQAAGDGYGVAAGRAVAL